MGQPLPVRQTRGVCGADFLLALSLALAAAGFFKVCVRGKSKLAATRILACDQRRAGGSFLEICRSAVSQARVVSAAVADFCPGRHFDGCPAHTRHCGFSFAWNAVPHAGGSFELLPVAQPLFIQK